jgi:hypothetical protein
LTASCLSPLWRPAKLITVRFGSAPSSRGRIDDRGVRVRPWAVAIARPAIRGCCDDRRSGAVGRGRSPDVRRSGAVGRGRSPDVRRSGAVGRGRSPDVRRSGAVGRGRSPDIRRSGRVGRGRSPDVRHPSSSASDSSSPNRSSCCRAAVFASMHSPANPSNARCRKGPTDPGFSRVQREFCR